VCQTSSLLVTLGRLMIAVSILVLNTLTIVTFRRVI
jgi:hypothetical protein